MNDKICCLVDAPPIESQAGPSIFTKELCEKTHRAQGEGERRLAHSTKVVLRVRRTVCLEDLNTTWTKDGWTCSAAKSTIKTRPKWSEKSALNAEQWAESREV